MCECQKVSQCCALQTHLRAYVKVLVKVQRVDLIAHIVKPSPVLQDCFQTQLLQNLLQGELYCRLQPARWYSTFLRLSVGSKRSTAALLLSKVAVIGKEHFVSDLATTAACRHFQATWRASLIEGLKARQLWVQRSAARSIVLVPILRSLVCCGAWSAAACRDVSASCCSTCSC